MRLGCSLLFFTLIYLILGGFAAADYCDPIILSIADKNPLLAYRPFSDRCEGFYSSRVAGSDFKVVGLTIGRFIYQMDPNEIVEISLPRHPQQKKLRIQAQAIQVQTYYRMDAELDGGQRLEWPVKDIIIQQPEKLTCNQIGLLAWEEMDGERVYFPVRALPQKAVAGPDQSLYIIISPLVDYDKFKWRLILTSTSGARTPTEWKDIGKVLMGHPIKILLKPETFGVVHLELEASINEVPINDTMKLDLGQQSTPP